MFETDHIEDETSLPELAKWVSEIADLTKPERRGMLRTARRPNGTG